jgi:hypothetical protein
MLGQVTRAELDALDAEGRRRKMRQVVERVEVGPDGAQVRLRLGARPGYNLRSCLLTYLIANQFHGLSSTRMGGNVSQKNGLNEPGIRQPGGMPLIEKEPGGMQLRSSSSRISLGRASRCSRTVKGCPEDLLRCGGRAGPARDAAHQEWIVLQVPLRLTWP